MALTHWVAETGDTMALCGHVFGPKVIYFNDGKPAGAPADCEPCEIMRELDKEFTKQQEDAV